MLALASLVAPLVHPIGVWLPVALFAMLLAAQLPLTTALVKRTGSFALIFFAPMSAIRAIWRGVGMTMGTLAWFTRKQRTR